MERKSIIIMEIDKWLKNSLKDCDRACSQKSSWKWLLLGLSCLNTQGTYE